MAGTYSGDLCSIGRTGSILALDLKSLQLGGLFQ